MSGKLTIGGVLAAEEFLARRDKIMARLIAEHPHCTIPRRKEPPFHVMAVSIINQQLSTKASAAIESRLAQLAPPPFCAENVRALSAQKLRDIGLSRNKARFLFALAEADDADVLSRRRLARLDDEQVIARLTPIAGVGRWTAEMFLMFALHRPNVLSLGDVGLCRAARRHYARRAFAGDDAALLQSAARKWTPYCTVACWHLWRAVD